MRELNRISQLLRFRCWLAWLLLAASGAAHGQSQAPVSPLERQVKAAYLYKFASFVEWPDASFERPDSALTIGVAGSDLLTEQLEKMVGGRAINGHPLRVRRVQRGEALADLHILFVDASLERGALADLLGAAQGHSLLTVSDADEAGALGCMINFVLAGDRLRFDIALKHVSPSRLRISARMLAVAHRVKAAT